MKTTALAPLVGLMVLVVVFYVGMHVGERPVSPTDTTGDELSAALERLTRALERVESQLETSSPMLATRSGGVPGDSGQAQVTEMLKGITERLDRLSKPPDTGFTPATPHDRSQEQDERLRALEEAKPAAVRREHFMWTGRDLLERYGVPDRAGHWTGMTVRWWYYLDREAPSSSRSAVFELIQGYVTSAFVQHKQ